MRRNSTSSIGAFHPVVFFTLVYGISLLLAIFVCRTVYYSMNESSANTNSKAQATVEASIGATALR
jgi:hypothetical protein